MNIRSDTTTSNSRIGILSTLNVSDLLVYLGSFLIYMINYKIFRVKSAISIETPKVLKVRKIFIIISTYYGARYSRSNR
jgi:hypothetical protein